jgi:hypothetical protein
VEVTKRVESPTIPGDLRDSSIPTVLTDALYAPGADHAVEQDGRPATVRADEDGRLRFTVDLGPPHGAQQSEFGAEPPPSWRRVRVGIRPA